MTLSCLSPALATPPVTGLVAGAFGDGPAADVELRLEAPRLRLGGLPGADREGGRVVVAVKRDDRPEVQRQHGIVAQVEARDVAEARLGVGPCDVHEIGRKGRRAVVEILEIDAHKAAREFAGDVGLDLPALPAGEADIARAFALAVEPADIEARVFAQLCPEVEIEPFLVEAQPRGELRAAAGLGAGARDDVDDAARRVGSEGRSRAAADRLDCAHREIIAQEDIGGDVEDVAEFEHRQPVLLELHVLGPARRERKPAHGVVVVALADAARHAQAGHGAQHLAEGTRAEALDVVALQAARRGCAVEPVAALGHAGGEDLDRGLGGFAFGRRGFGGGLARVIGTGGAVAIGCRRSKGRGAQGPGGCEE